MADFYIPINKQFVLRKFVDQVDEAVKQWRIQNPTASLYAYQADLTQDENGNWDKLLGVKGKYLHRHD